MQYRRAVLSLFFLCGLVFIVSQNTVANGLQNPSSIAAVVASIKSPVIETPAWAQPPAPAPAPTAHVVYYAITSHGTITNDMGEFAMIVGQTLHDSRGWSRLGITFQQVSSGANVTIVLSQASLVPDYSSGCGATLSCTVGNTIIINQDRWQTGVDFWLQQDNSLTDYREMVINHEMGHWLGHDHVNCPGAGQLAPVMRQQSVDLQGCVPNPWPLASELWSTRLGIN